MLSLSHFLGHGAWVASIGLVEQQMFKYSLGLNLRYKKTDLDDNCPICYESMADSKPCTLLLCKHKYHTECLKKWKSEIGTCPYCRRPAVTDEEKKTVLKLIEESDIMPEEWIKFNDHADVVTAVVKKNGVALKFASDDLRKNRDIVLAAVKQNGWALEHASAELRKDREIVLAAIGQNVGLLVLGYASDELKKDEDFVNAATQRRVFRYY